MGVSNQQELVYAVVAEDLFRRMFNTQFKFVSGAVLLNLLQ